MHKYRHLYIHIQTYNKYVRTRELDGLDLLSSLLSEYKYPLSIYTQQSSKLSQIDTNDKKKKKNDCVNDEWLNNFVLD